MKTMKEFLEIRLEQIENDLAKAEESWNSYLFDELMTKRAEIKRKIKAIENAESNKNHTQKLH